MWGWLWCLLVNYKFPSNNKQITHTHTQMCVCVCDDDGDDDDLGNINICVFGCYGVTKSAKMGYGNAINLYSVCDP